MNVRLKIEVSTPPTASNLDNLRSAASELTNNLKSIVVSTDEDSKGFLLITVFTIETTAEYKVVDRISKEFKFCLLEPAENPLLTLIFEHVDDSMLLEIAKADYVNSLKNGGIRSREYYSLQQHRTILD